MTIKERLLGVCQNLTFKGSKQYWEDNYKKGLTSGIGSYGELAEFKAEVINDFVKENNIQTAIDFGCGDGNQASLLNIPYYTGIDVSVSAITRCLKRFKEDKTKTFAIYTNFSNHTDYDLSLSLDVIYHLVEQDVFEKYIKDLFGASDKYVIVYSTNRTLNGIHAYSKNRVFTDYVPKEWKLIKTIKGNNPDSGSDFFIFGKEIK